MEILAYDQVDPEDVFHITMLALGSALTPEISEHLQRTAHPPHPDLSVCAVEDDMVVGYAGVYPQPVLTIAGWEDVGCFWAVCIHPQYTGRGIATRLLEEVHVRMHAIGLRFSMFHTKRSLSAYQLWHAGKRRNSPPGCALCRRISADTILQNRCFEMLPEASWALPCGRNLFHDCRRGSSSMRFKYYGKMTSQSVSR